MSWVTRASGSATMQRRDPVPAARALACAWITVNRPTARAVLRSEKRFAQGETHARSHAMRSPDDDRCPQGSLTQQIVRPASLPGDGVEA
jgi:hypothetical protein